MGDDDKSSPSQAILYARQSQDKHRSTDQQKDDGQVRADGEGWPVFAVYRDGTSASRYAKKGRADWTRLLKDLENPAVGILWLWESSRGDRALTSWSAMLDTCRAHDVLIYVETHARLYDMNNARDWRTLAEDGIDSAYEVEKTRERVKRDTRVAAIKGMPHGKITYGFRREYEWVHGRRVMTGQVVDEDGGAPVVREIYRRFVENRELEQWIAADLTNRGVPTARGARLWRRSTVQQILKNPAYVGDRWHNGVLVKRDAWPGIVDRDTWDRAQARFVTDKPRRHEGFAKSLLSGIAKCECGGSMYRRRSNKHPDYYVCIDCLRVSRHAEWLEGHVTERAVAAMAEKQQAITADDSRASDHRLAVARNELAALNARLELWQASSGDDGVSPESVGQAERKLAPQIEAAKKRVRKLSLPSELALVDGPIEEVWDDLPFAQKRALIRATVTVTVHRIGRAKQKTGVTVVVR